MRSKLINKNAETITEEDKDFQFYEKFFKKKSTMLGKDNPNISDFYNNVGSFYNSKGDYSKALEYHEKAFYSQLKRLGKNHHETITTYNNILRVSSQNKSL